MRLGECDDDTVEGIAVEPWQGGRRARDAGVKRDFAQVVLLGQTKEPLDRGLH